MDEALARLTREWLTKAWHDLQTARITAHAADGPLDTAIYHCQQAGEKSVKAWLTASSIPFEKTPRHSATHQAGGGCATGLQSSGRRGRNPHALRFRFPVSGADRRSDAIARGI